MPPTSWNPKKTGFSEQTKFQILWLSTEWIEINLMVSVDYKQKCSHNEDNTTDKSSADVKKFNRAAE